MSVKFVYYLKNVRFYNLPNIYQRRYYFYACSNVLNNAIVKESSYIENRLMSLRHLNVGLTLPISETLEPLTERPLTPFTSPLASPVSISPESPSGLINKVKDGIEKAIKKRGTKSSSTSIDNDVREIIQHYPALIKTEKQEILLYIAKNFSTNSSYILDIVNAIPKFEKHVGGYISPSDKEAFTRWEDKLRQSLQPSYHWLITQISRLPGGVKFVVDLREDVLTFLSSQLLSREDQTALKALDASLRELLSLWFTVGLLNLQRITWESPCDILQKVSEYEAVHPMRNWTDLKRRVGNYRRCFIFTHACMPNEPLVVLHTYLTNGISNNMSKIVQRPRNLSFDESSMKAGEDSSTITTAIFYSITSTQKGLTGIELGNYLIKRVVRELQSELPNLTKFSSLSPIPGFVKWLDSNLIKAQRGEVRLLVSSEIQALENNLEVCGVASVYAELRRLLKTNAWARDDNLKVLLEPPFMRLTSYYLYMEKRRGYALDPVANFHLRNGAVMWRINWNADKSPRGMDKYCGIMVNYRYFLENCESNSKTYLETCKITASDAVIYLAKMAEDIMNKHTDSTFTEIKVPTP